MVDASDFGVSLSDMSDKPKLTILQMSWGSVQTRQRHNFAEKLSQNTEFKHELQCDRRGSRLGWTAVRALQAPSVKKVGGRPDHT